MNRKSWLYFALGLGISLVLCVGLGAVGYLFYILPTLESGGLSGVVGPEPTAIEIAIETPLGADVDLEALFSPLWTSRELIHTYYVEPVEDATLAQGALDGLMRALTEANADISTVTIPAGAASVSELSSEAATPVEVESEFAAFWEAWQKVEYIELTEGLTYEGLMEGALAGMVSAVGDDYTSYLDPDELQQLNISLEGDYEGIGAFVDPTGEYLAIIAPIQGSPAEAAGLLPGDLVIAVDGEDMTGIDGNLVIRRVLGPAGSTVILTIQREGVEEPFDVEIVRAHIIIPSVEGRMLEGDIAYVQLFNFGDSTAADLRVILEDLLSQNPRGLILDLRNNGGGFLHSAVDITSEFVPEGVALYEVYGDGTRDEYEVNGEGIATDIPMVVLVNEGTASASEILAGAIQDYERGTLVGTVTFGKGSVQQVFDLGNGRGSVRITVARWLTPDERQIHGVGLTPDFEVVLTPEDFAAGLDPQLDMAIEILVNP